VRKGAPPRVRSRNKADRKQTGDDYNARKDRRRPPRGEEGTVTIPNAVMAQALNGEIVSGVQIMPWRCGVRIRISMASSAFLCDSRSAATE
jgi:hypothetical protein